MTMTVPDNTTPPPVPGRVSRALIRMFMKPARIVQAESLGEDVRLITMASPAFRNLQWTPGDKLQIAMGSAFVARTYTPVEWDSAEGATRIVAFAHGSGPGSEWVRRTAPGDTCHVFGPRSSLDLTRATPACVMLGDETSIALAYALSCSRAEGDARYLLEVGDVANVREVLARLNLGGVELFARSAYDQHLETMAGRLSALADDATMFVLTGKASSIQRWRRALNAKRVRATRIMTKAYWAPGKAGLD
ncbi:NADPH-dependent ferric-chelate reductase [Pandoraea pulmonicola]|uniref:NADPH-dependent ferric-chelate reductase n=2 Tax=Pandoraea pulmonicola TaxID=93221 RepID=A0AAJ4Z8J0_PANPU|nr:NADPH-dependent ferric-chelate reductase [Pandoraea pulmonicola]